MVIDSNVKGTQAAGASAAMSLGQQDEVLRGLLSLVETIAEDEEDEEDGGVCRTGGWEG